MTLPLILGILDKLLALALMAMESMTPEQRTAFWDRHEARIAFFTGLAERFKGE